MTSTLPEHHVVAINTATASENKIHDDEVAGRFGFAGGLVPGVDVYGYLCHPVLELWGERWLGDGTATVRFDQPVYHGEAVRVTASVEAGGTLVAEAHTDAGRRARLAAAVVDGDVDRHRLVPSIERAPRALARPAASAELFASQPTLATLTVTCTDDDHRRYLEEIADVRSATTEWGVCHPGWLLRLANSVLVTSIELGPWIHVGSTVQHLRLVRRGTEVEVRGRVRDAHERKGHRFVELDVVVSGPDGPAVVVDHRAIYQPRPMHGPA